MRRWIAATAATATALVLAGCTELPAGTDGDVTNGWAAIAGPTPVTPPAGTCHEELQLTAGVRDHRPVPCTDLHATETVAVGTFAGRHRLAATTPEHGSGAELAAYQDCSKRASAFVGGPWRSGRIAVHVVLPSAQGWAGGARWYRCDVSEADLHTEGQRTRKGSMARGLVGTAPLGLHCFNPTIAGDGVERMTAVSCRKKHRAEFAGLWTAPAGLTYARMRGSDKRIAAGCRGVIARYAKVPNDANLQYRVGWIAYNPTEEEWDRGVRDLQCFLWLSRRTPTRSLKGGGTSGLPIQYG